MSVHLNPPPPRAQIVWYQEPPEMGVVLQARCQSEFAFIAIRASKVGLSPWIDGHTVP